MKKAIQINAFERKVVEVLVGDDYKDIYPFLSGPEFEVGCFTVVNIGNEDSIYIDDEGLLKDCDAFFMYEGYPQPLAGNGLILGCDEEGDSIDAKIDVVSVAQRVRFLNREQAIRKAPYIADFA